MAKNEEDLNGAELKHCSGARIAASFRPSLSSEITVERVWNFRVTSEKSLELLQLDWSSAARFALLCCSLSLEMSFERVWNFVSPVSFNFCSQTQDRCCTMKLPLLFPAVRTERIWTLRVTSEIERQPCNLA